MPPCDAKPVVLIIEPYAGSGGHFDQGPARARRAFAVAGFDARIVTVGDAQRSIRVAARLGSMVLEALVRALSRRGPVVDDASRRRDARRSARVAGARALGVELPSLLAARRIARALRVQNRRAIALVCSSYLRPLWLKPFVLGQATPLVEQVFASGPPERTAPFGCKVRIAATTRRAARAAVHGVPGAGIRVVAHHPLPARRIISPEAVGTDLRDTLARAHEHHRYVGLHFGVMHWKKDLHTIIRGTRHLPRDVALLVVGDPAREGDALPPDVWHLLENAPNVFAVLRTTTEEEREWLFSACDFCVVSQKLGFDSMSGSTIDALAFEISMVGTGDTAVGDLIDDLAVGAVHAVGDTAGFARAVSELSSSNFEFRPRRDRYPDHGLFAQADWAEQIADLAGD